MAAILGFTEMLRRESKAGRPATPAVLDKLAQTAKSLAARLAAGTTMVEAKLVQRNRRARAPVAREADAPGRILVVDDLEDNLLTIAAILMDSGHQVETASDGREALGRIARGGIDLVLLDVVMPGMGGIDALREVRRTHDLSDLPVIMATAMDTSHMVVEALSLGANDYVLKPFDVDVVLARIRTALGLKRSKEQVARLVEDLEVRNRFIREAFGRYLTEEVVESLLESPAGLSLGGQRREVTVLMSDIRGFTTLSERLAPEEVIAMLNDYLGTMTDVIQAHQGTIDEFIGDAILVIFGAPVQRPDDARRAVKCALAMQAAMAGVNERLAGIGLPPIVMGIAVNTGEVVVGNIGSHKRAKYGVVGSHVNATARIQSHAEGGQVLVSEFTLRAAGAGIETGPELSIQAKGFERPLKIHEVTSA